MMNEDFLKAIAHFAEDHNALIISDEVYFNMVYNGKNHAHSIDAVDSKVPLIVMRGMSKDVPWPGGRCRPTA